jgi:subtilase family serine protease
MASISKRFTVPGSERAAVRGAKSAGEVRPDERIEVTVRVRPKTTLQSLAVGAVQDDAPPAQRKYLSREEYARDHGADPQDMAKVRDFAQAHHLSVVESDAARRGIVLSGDAKSMSDAFGVTLHYMEHEGGTYRGRTGAITVPIELADVVQGVFGLDDRPQADPHFQPRQPVGVFTARARSVSVTPPALAKLYEFPTGVNGAGQCIGIIGYEVRVDGQKMVIGGTTAVASLWAGLVALMNQSLGKPVGFLNPLLYGSLAGKGLFNDITSGNNGACHASSGWDACTGWGSPNGEVAPSAGRLIRQARERGNATCRHDG